MIASNNCTAPGLMEWVGKCCADKHTFLWSFRRLHIIKPSKGMISILEKAVSNGDTVILESLGEYVDPTLGPILSRRLTKRNGVDILQLGDREVCTLLHKQRVLPRRCSPALHHEGEVGKANLSNLIHESQGTVWRSMT